MSLLRTSVVIALLAAGCSSDSGGGGDDDGQPLACPEQTGGGAIAFDGVDDHAKTALDPALGLSKLTIEAWVRRDGEGSTFTTGAGGLRLVPIAGKGLGEGDGTNVDCNYAFGFWGDVLGADFEDMAAGANHPVMGKTAIPRGEWHHVALTWRGLPQSTVMLYIDGKPAIWPATPELSLWDDIERFKFTLRTYVHDNLTIDDLRISSVARTDEEMQKAFATGVTEADLYTLLLDRFESLQQKGDQTFTVAEVFADGLGQPGGRVLIPKLVELVEGKSGKGLKLFYR